MCLKNSSAVASSVIDVEHGMNVPNLVSLSTITRILLKPSDVGKSGMKSIVTTSKGRSGIGMGCNNPTGG